MFDVGGPEFLFLVLLALIVFGPRRLPTIGRQLGEQAARLRRSWLEVRRELEREVSAEDLRSVRDEARSLGGEVRRLRDEFVDPPRRGASGEDPAAGTRDGEDAP